MSCDNGRQWSDLFNFGHTYGAQICAPTRELAQQIYTETKRYGTPHGLHVAAVYGGDSKWEQQKVLQGGAEICVATPGRLIDMVKAKATRLDRVTYLVLDEADRMFDMGFGAWTGREGGGEEGGNGFLTFVYPCAEPQVKSIVNTTRPDRQSM